MVNLLAFLSLTLQKRTVHGEKLKVLWVAREAREWRPGKGRQLLWGQVKDEKLQGSSAGWEIFRHSQDLLCFPRRESEWIGKYTESERGVRTGASCRQMTR